MKMILAYIKPAKLQDAVLAAHRIEGLPGLTVSEARGFGRPRTVPTSEARREQVQDFVPCARLEILCPEDLVDRIVETIKQATHTGLRGDGMIFVLPVEQDLRIG